MIDRVVVVYNAHSGSLAGEGDASPVDRLQLLFNQRGVTARLLEFDPDTIATELRAVLVDAPQAVLVAGGDGTVLAVAGVLLDADVPLGILPGGTMNVLARDLDIPLDIEVALDALLPGETAQIDIARVNGAPFLCSSLVGLMPHLGRLREEARGSRNPLHMAGLLLRSLRTARRYPRLRVSLTVDGVLQRVHTRAIMVSNNPFCGKAALLPRRDAIDLGRLALYVTRDRSLWDLVRTGVELARGQWPPRDRLIEVQGTVIEIDIDGTGLTSVMSDGEARQLQTPLVYTMSPGALTVLRPSGATGA